MAVVGRSCWRWHLGPNVPGGVVGSPGAPEAVQMECRRFRRPCSVSERTTRPRLGEDCWSRGLQSALLLLVLRRSVSHRRLLPWLIPTASMRRRAGAIGVHAHCSAARAGRDWGVCGSRPPVVAMLEGDTPPPCGTTAKRCRSWAATRQRRDAAAFVTVNR